ALPSEAAVQVALRTQQIIAYESGVADTVDPLAGSYYNEYLTDEIERRAMDYIARIDAMGGATRAIETGYIQNEIQEAAYATARAIESGEQIVVGVNKFQTSAETPPGDLLRIDEAVQAGQIARLRALRAGRDADAVAGVLARLHSAAQDPAAPLMPLFIEAVEAYATLGEICGTLRQVFGEYRP
ncbi:MAG: methylmalonyl-CoA mutase family protein, partial [Anaerolineae bacterium]